MSDALSVCRSVSALDLSHNSLEDAGIKALSEIFHKNYRVLKVSVFDRPDERGFIKLGHWVQELGQFSAIDNLTATTESSSSSHRSSFMAIDTAQPVVKLRCRRLDSRPNRSVPNRGMS